MLLRNKICLFSAQSKTKKFYISIATNEKLAISDKNCLKLKRKREKKPFISFLSNGKQRSTLAVTADVALLAPFGIEECAVSAVRAEVAHHVQEFSKASATVRWPHRLSAAVIAVVTCP